MAILPVAIYESNELRFNDPYYNRLISIANQISCERKENFYENTTPAENGKKFSREIIFPNLEFLLQFVRLLGDSPDLNAIFLDFHRAKEVDLATLVKTKNKTDTDFLSYSMG